MYSKRTVIVNSTGLHARPAARFANEVKKYKSRVSLKKLNSDNDKETVIGTVMSVLTLGIKQNTEIELTAEGEDEIEAVEALVALVESGFGE